MCPDEIEAGNRGLRDLRKTKRGIFAKRQQKLRTLIRVLRHLRRHQTGKNRGSLSVSEHLYRGKQSGVLRAVIARIDNLPEEPLKQGRRLEFPDRSNHLNPVGRPWPWSSNRVTVPRFCIARRRVQHSFRDCHCLWPPALATGCQPLQVRQDGNNTSLKQHVYSTGPAPEDERRPMIGPLVGCAFIARSLR